VTFEQGAASDAFYLVAHGEVSLSVGDLGRSSSDSWKIERGGLFGDLDFLLRRPRTFTAAAAVGATVVYACSRDSLRRMEREEPRLYQALLNANLQCLAMSADAMMWQQAR